MPTQFAVTPARPEDQSLLERLVQFYLYDTSVCVEADLESTGVYSAPLLYTNGSASKQSPFVLRLGLVPIGFALISKHSYFNTPFNGHCCDALFVLRRHRRQRFGQMAAHSLFARFPGPWEIAAPANNPPAQSFWRAVVDRFTRGRYTERWLHTNDFRGNIQTFAVANAELLVAAHDAKGAQG